MKETRILCDICGKVIDSQSPAQFYRDVYICTPEQIEKGDAVLPTKVRASVVIAEVNADDPFTYDACEECVRETIKVGKFS